MINAEQIRAARGLLDWNTAELAKLSGLTVNGINKIERGYVQGRRETMDILQSVFEKAGIEFLPGSGVRKRDRIVQTFEGEEAQQNLLNDVYETLKFSGGEILIAHVDEQVAIQHLSEEFLSNHIKRLHDAGITERMLISVNDTHVLTTPESYRTIPDEFFIATPMFIYGEKLALLSWNPMPKAVIVNDPTFAESARRLFNFAWSRAQTPSTYALAKQK